MNCSSGYHKLDGLLATLGGWWGWSFFLTGKGRLLNLEKTTAFFTDLGLPLPKLNAILAGSTECLGGLLLLLGLGSRLASVPLIFTMSVAYATADHEALHAIFSDPDKFTGATPFLFLFACVIVFAFGPGKLSLDALLFKSRRSELRGNFTADNADKCGWIFAARVFIRVIRAIRGKTIWSVDGPVRDRPYFKTTARCSSGR